MLEMSCAPKSFRWETQTVANAVKRGSSFWPTLANAHAVLTSVCGFKCSICRCAAIARAANRHTSFWPTAPNAQAMLETSYRLTHPVCRLAVTANTANSSAS
eukprot:gnl/MRDRNA2_/MRDRNA2_73497_c0_seq1.p2 gnl/MRDRNA2_/MRDRNA2_73497_c0~~gnl/MRDRNA2_/MRDRNA2_73497_c0_seq1.p2  ORF type:complete len:102 (+),score=5.64 gnl/MRDRNA2_/MRDRNA2_73497_c0_seq1:180-485(+)